MYKIVRKRELNSAVTLMEIEAPFVEEKPKPASSSSSVSTRKASGSL